MTIPKKKIYMLNLNIGESLTGIESSAMSRAEMMRLHLGVEPVIVTSYWNPDLQKNIRTHEEAGRMPAGLNVVSMFDYYQDAISYAGDIESGFQYKDQPGIGASKANGEDLRLFKGGERFAYVCRRPHNKSVRFINYIEGEKVWQRVWFDSRGFASKVEFVDSKHYGDDGRCEHYLRPDGSIALIRLYEFDEGKKRRHKLTIHLGKDGSPLNQFHDDEGMIQFFLESISGEGATFIVDRIKEYYPSVRSMKIRDPKIEIIPVYHNTHYAQFPDKPGDPFLSAINSFHKASLDDYLTPRSHIVFTQKQKEDIISRFGWADVRVIPHSHASEYYSGWEERDRYSFIMLGRLAEEKQHWLAVRAFSEVVKRHPMARLTIYGRGEKEKLIKDTINELGLSANVKLEGFSHSVKDVYRSAGCMLLSSRNEGFAMVVMESLFNGCPVISFDCNYGPGSMVIDGVNGRLIRPQDFDALSQAMIGILDDEEGHRKMVECASESMHGFTHERVAELWRDLIAPQNT